jgi:hypothetical protein
MSPNSHISWCDEKRLLCGYDGENSSPTFIWTYSIFEEHNGDAVTPSMYEYMTTYVASNITKDQLREIECDEYYAGDLEEAAVAAYYEVPILTRVKLHQQMLENLEAEYTSVTAKEVEATNWMLGDSPFDVTSAIYVEVCTFMKDLIAKLTSKSDKLRQEIIEEEQWWSGAEEDCSLSPPPFDPMEEV